MVDEGIGRVFGHRGGRRHAPADQHIAHIQRKARNRNRSLVGHAGKLQLILRIRMVAQHECHRERFLAVDRGIGRAGVDGRFRRNIPAIEEPVLIGRNVRHGDRIPVVQAAEH